MEAFFVIDGEPKGKARPRFSGKTGRTYTPQQTVNFENYVKWCWTQSRQPMLEGMVCAEITAYMQIPKSASKKAREKMLCGSARPTKKPDFDNLAKSVCDSLNGLAYHDDSQITDAIVKKRYSDNPRTEVRLKEVVV